jgi:hypothetical protein
MFAVSTNIQVLVDEEDFSIVDEKKFDALARHMMDDIGDFAVKSFLKHTPFDPDAEYHMNEHIDKGDVNKFPGGYSIEVGITPVEEAAAFGADPEYPRLVDEGSGNLSGLTRSGVGTQVREKSSGQFGSNLEKLTARASPIFSPAGNIMAFEKRGEVVFTRWIKPQVGQFFSDLVFKESNNYITRRKQEFRLELKAIT